MSFLIRDKIALVTGANRGIGKAIVESFLKHGAKKVYLAVRDPKSTAALEEQYGPQVKTIQADVSDAASIKALAEAAQDVEVVVNNAGVLQMEDLFSTNAEAALKKEMSVNVFGLLYVAQAFEKILKSNKGALVQLNSVASIKNFTDASTYSASKAAAYSITQGLKDKFAEHGVVVLSVHPGPINTDMGQQVGFEEMDSASNVSEGIVASLEAGEFLLFPDPMAKQFASVYQSYADAMITAEAAE